MGVAGEEGRFGDLSKGLRRIKSRTGACPRNT